LLTTSLSRADLQSAFRSISPQDINIEAVLPTLEMVFAELTAQAEREQHTVQGEEHPR
jgi:hypothetical protein